MSEEREAVIRRLVHETIVTEDGRTILLIGLEPVEEEEEDDD